MNIANGLQITNGSDPGKVNITADCLVIQGIEHLNVSLVADLNVAGANGRDAGSETANSWWSVWAACDGSGLPSSLISLLSLSTTDPAMPGGETNKFRLFWVRNDAGSDLYRWIHAPGSNWIRWNEDTVLGFNRVVSAGTAAVYTDFSCAVPCPPTCRRVSARIIATATGGRTNPRTVVKNKDLTNITTLGGSAGVGGTTVADGSFSSNQMFGLDSSQGAQYRVRTAGDLAYVDIHWYEDIRG